MKWNARFPGWATILMKKKLEYKKFIQNILFNFWGFIINYYYYYYYYIYNYIFFGTPKVFFECIWKILAHVFCHTYIKKRIPEDLEFPQLYLLIFL